MENLPSKNNPLPAGAVAASPVMLENRSRLLSYLGQRVDSRAADEILRSAYEMGMQTHASPRDNEKITNWFFRLMKDVLFNYEQRKGPKTENDQARADWELKQNVSQFVTNVISTMKEQHSDILKKTEVENKNVGDNMSVPLHRARVSLTKKILQTCSVCAEHKSLNCSCSNGFTA